MKLNLNQQASDKHTREWIDIWTRRTCSTDGCTYLNLGSSTWTTEQASAKWGAIYEERGKNTSNISCTSTSILHAALLNSWHTSSLWHFSEAAQTKGWNSTKDNMNSKESRGTWLKTLILGNHEYHSKRSMTGDTNTQTTDPTIGKEWILSLLKKTSQRQETNYG